MNDRIIKYDLELYTITPISVGNDESSDFSPYTDYIQDGKEIIILDNDKINAILEKSHELVDLYVKGVGRMDKSKTRSEFDFKSFIKNKLNADIDSLTKKKFTVYGNTGKAAIKACMSSSGRYFIPGSTLKGGIRTALIYDWLTSDNDGKIIINNIIKETERTYERIMALLEKKARDGDRLSFDDDKTLKELRNSFTNKRLFGRIYDESVLFGLTNKEGSDARYLQVSDTGFFKDGEMKVYNTNRVKLRFPGEKNPIWKLSVSENVSTDFSLSLVNEFRNGFLKKLNKNGIKEIFKTLNKFSLASAEMESQQISDSGFAGKEAYASVYEFYESLKTEIQSPGIEYGVMRSGAGKTFFDNSIGLAIYWQNPETFNKYRKLLELGKNPKTKELSEGRFPSTRSFIEFNGRYAPPGWLRAGNIENISRTPIFTGFDISQFDFTKEEANTETTVQDVKATIAKRPPNSVIAELIDITGNKPKVRIKEGQFEGKETELHKVIVSTAKLKSGDEIYVALDVIKVKNEKRLQGAAYLSKTDKTG